VEAHKNLNIKAHANPDYFSSYERDTNTNARVSQTATSSFVPQWSDDETESVPSLDLATAPASESQTSSPPTFVPQWDFFISENASLDLGNDNTSNTEGRGGAERGDTRVSPMPISTTVPHDDYFESDYTNNNNDCGTAGVEGRGLSTTRPSIFCDGEQPWVNFMSPGGKWLFFK
jgi:hypothetical protein